MNKLNTTSTELSLLTEQLMVQLRDFVITYGMRVLGALVLIIVGYLAAKLLSKKMEALVRRSKNADTSVGTIVRKASFVGVMLMVLIAVLERFGVETTSFIAVLGAAGLAIGLALQGTLSNIAAGVMLLVLRPFRAGDAVQIGGGEVYLIDEIGLFVTRAHKPDCPKVMIPNAKIWGDTIVNYSNTQDGNRRFDILFGIAYNDNISEAIDVLQQLANDDERVLKDPAPFIKVDSLGDSSVNILFRVHTKASDWWDAKLDLTKLGKEALEANGKSIPFPQRDVHLFNQPR
ncbi:MAG: mechanosensitive ion channel [Deltaproteobacteria bacterium]|nr:mechanosensitive ion channel [Deltaproteobacteria bacterium]